MNPATTAPPPDVTRPQSGATIKKPINPADVDALKALLATFGDTIGQDPRFPFAGLADAHFLCWFVVDGYAATGPMLYFELNVDGPVEPFLHDLVKQLGKGLDAIYAHCAGYPAAGSASPRQVVAYLLQDNIGYDCYYIGWRGLTVRRILREQALRDRLEGALDRQDDATLAAMSPGPIRKLLQDEVEADPSLHWARTFPPPPFLVRYGDRILQGLGVLAIAVVIGLIALGWMRYGPGPTLGTAAAIVTALAALVGVFFLMLWLHEKNDSVYTAGPNHGHVADVASLENRIIQNHFASVEPVKAGLFRMVVLKAVLKAIHVLAAISLNKGNLSGITSIHFARWVVIDGGDRLLFLSNYDGSWENYLDDFIDRAHQGLTAIWSNTVGFPRSYFLVEGGATDELAFKTITRKSQLPSLVWYSAYPDLTIQNIQSNRAIREGLFAGLDAKAEQAWLALF